MSNKLRIYADTSVNVHKIRIYNWVNLEMGYTPIEIRTPKEVIFNEKE